MSSKNNPSDPNKDPNRYDKNNNFFQNQKPPARKSVWIRYLPWIIGLIVLCLIIYFAFFYNNYPVISFNNFLALLRGGKIDADKRNQISVQFLNGVMILKGYYYYSGSRHYFMTSAPDTSVIVGILFGNGSSRSTGLLSNYFKSTIFLTTTTNWLDIIIRFLPILFIIFFGVLLFRFLAKQRGGDIVGKSKFNLSPRTALRFNDVAGYIEEKVELKEIISFLRSPRRFVAMGIRPPKGVMLVGPPGTGKTFLAKAVAGEANVAFYNISASEFVELFVGLGASRIRELFKKAKHTLPCIIYIDEIDAVGRQRGAGMGGGNDEREQTLNQLLVELDGFTQSSGLVVMASTNRIDVLDPALLRPGRFDRIISVHLPNLSEREQILKIHARNKNCDSRISWRAIARRTSGFSGAQLENILNEAALISLRFNHKIILISDVDEAIDRVIGGPAKKSRVYTDKEKLTVSYHESGHALIGLLLPDADEVLKITIIPRGQAGGYTMMAPKDETYLLSKKELFNKITGYLGGRASEEILFGSENITSGASDDISKATTIARKMVTELGMSDLGVIKYEEDQHDPFLGREMASPRRNFSNEIYHQIDEEIRKIMDQCYVIAIDLIKNNRALLDILAKSLYELEILTSEQIQYIVKNKDYPEEYRYQKKLDKAEETRLVKVTSKEVFRPKTLSKNNSYDPAKTKQTSSLPPSSPKRDGDMSQKSNATKINKSSKGTYRKKPGDKKD